MHEKRFRSTWCSCIEQLFPADIFRLSNAISFSARIIKQVMLQHCALTTKKKVSLAHAICEPLDVKRENRYGITEIEGHGYAPATMSKSSIPGSTV